MKRFFLNRKDSVIIIIDIQERLAAVMEEKERVINNAIQLIEASKLLKIPIIITEQYPKGLGSTVKEIRYSLMEHYKPLEKLTFSCCRDSGFMESLRATDKKMIILTGMETHVCILQTCLDLLNDGYYVHVVKDAVCSRTYNDFVTGIELMRDAGAVISCKETVLFQLLEKAGTEEFKAVSKMIK